MAIEVANAAIAAKEAKEATAAPKTIGALLGNLVRLPVK